MKKASVMGCGKPREACGVCGVFGVPGAAEKVYYGLYALQHRGQESAGIVASDRRRVRSVKGMGLVSEVVDRDALARLAGDIAIGHVRYSTSGASKPQNTQPLVMEYSQGLLAVAHNGNLVNARTLRRELEAHGSIFQTGTDSEVIVHLMARPRNTSSHTMRLRECLRQLKGAFSFVFMTPESMIAVCDPQKFRPLAIGTLEGGYIVASETCAFDILGARYLREVEPGEIVVFSDAGMESTFFVDEEERKPAHCIFEMIYFARPDSLVFGVSVHRFRTALGNRLCREHPADADIVVAVPDSGNSAAIGFANGAGIPYQRGFIRNHYIGRTFIQPHQEMRELSVRMKLNVIADQVRGRRLVVVDDSLIRGTTSRSRLECLRKAGAGEVHMRLSSPPCRYPCYYGIDFPSPEELIASSHSVEQIRRIIGADTLGYLSIEGLLEAAPDPSCWCHACFSGEYPVPPVDHMEDKYAMETRYREE